MMSKVVIKYEKISGIFKEFHLQKLLSELDRFGLPVNSINVLMSQTTGDNLVNLKSSSKAPEGATVGGLAGGLTLVGTVLVPGVGLLASGALVGALAGGAAGAGTGGLIGALVGWGLPEHEAQEIENSLQESGNVLVMVEVPKELTPEIKAVFQRYEVEGLKVKS